MNRNVMDDADRCGRLRVCPHVDRNDARCANRFNLRRMEQAMSVCFGAYHACPMYQQINADLASERQRKREPSIVTMSIEGERAALRPTGT